MFITISRSTAKKLSKQKVNKRDKLFLKKIQTKKGKEEEKRREKRDGTVSAQK